MGSGIISSVVAVAGFTGLGVAAMYLLDPEQGERRRRSLLAAADRATASTEEAIRATVERARDSAGSAVHSAAHEAGSVLNHAERYAHDLVDRVTDRFSSTADRVESSVGSTHAKARAAIKDHIDAVAAKAKGWLSKGSDAVEGVHDDLTDRVSDYRSRAHGAADHLQGKHDGHPGLVATGITAGTVGAVAIGAGIAYFLDPAQGRGRRGEVLRTVTNWGRRVGFSFREYGRQLAIGHQDDSPGESPSGESPSAESPSGGSPSGESLSAEPFRISNGSQTSFEPSNSASSI